MRDEDGCETNETTLLNIDDTHNQIVISDCNNGIIYRGLTNILSVGGGVRAFALQHWILPAKVASISWQQILNNTMII